MTTESTEDAEKKDDRERDQREPETLDRMEDWREWLTANNELVEEDIAGLVASDEVLLKEANPPKSPGVYNLPDR